jgi:histidinol-phosphate phosphatase family protein
MSDPRRDPGLAARSARAAVFLDKDGTVLQDVPYNVDPALMRFAPGAAEALAQLAATGMPLFVVSNQSGVARGRFPEQALEAVRERLADMFAACGARLTGFVYCPHAPADDGAPACDCRKPSPGMLQRLARAHRLDLTRSWMVGDILDDIEAGRRAGCCTILIDNGNETVWRRGAMREPHHRVPELAAAARIIVDACRRVDGEVCA